MTPRPHQRLKQKTVSFFLLTAMKLPTEGFNGLCVEGGENHKNLNLANGKCKYLHLLYYKGVKVILFNWNLPDN